MSNDSLIWKAISPFSSSSKSWSPNNISSLKFFPPSIYNKYFLSDNIFISEGNSFEYTVKATVKEIQASISFVSNGITTIIPRAILDDWFQSEKIGVKEDIINENGESITLSPLNFPIDLL